MYLPGQIIHSFDIEGPVVIEDVWDLENYPKQHSHYIDLRGAIWTGNGIDFVDRVSPYDSPRKAPAKSLKKAQALLVTGAIMPAWKKEALLTKWWERDHKAHCNTCRVLGHQCK